MARYDDDIYGQYVYSPTRKTAAQARTSSNGRFGVFVVIALSLAAILIIIFLFNPFQAAPQKTIDFDKKTFYAVQLISTTDATQAALAAQSIKQNKGAGFVKKETDNYLVFAAIYTSESDAQNVISKITDYTAQKYMLDIAAKSVSFSGSDEYRILSTQKIQQLYSVLEGLIKLANDFDNSVITEDDTKKQVIASYNSLNSLYAQIQYLFEGQSAEFYGSIKSIILSMLTELHEIRSYSGSNPLSAEIRHCAIKQLFSLADTMKTK